VETARKISISAKTVFNLSRDIKISIFTNNSMIMVFQVPVFQVGISGILGKQR
jgi:hypothetical protein